MPKSCFIVMKVVIDTLWFAGWTFGGVMLVATHWFIAVPMWMLAPLPASYHLYLHLKKK